MLPSRLPNNVSPLSRLVLFSPVAILMIAGFGSISAGEPDAGRITAFLRGYCQDCHAGEKPSGDFNISPLLSDLLSESEPDRDSSRWERILRRLRAGQMPPPDADRPPEADYLKAIESLEQRLELHSQRYPFAGKPEALRRLNRTEYQNAIRDLLSVNVDANALLPKDESTQGFDNITVGELSPTLLNRYISAAQGIARLVMGGQGIGPMGINIRVPADRTQEQHVHGLPLGTRGGILTMQTFPRTGLYEIQLRLMRDRDEKVEGLSQEHTIDVLIDRERKHQFKVGPPPKREDFTHVDSHLRTRIPITAGTHAVGVAFLENGAPLLETKRQPFDASYNRHRHPRVNPALFELSIVGPFDSSEPGKSQSRNKIYGSTPVEFSEPRNSASQIIKRLARSAFRREVTDEDIESAMWFFEEAYQQPSGSAPSRFDAGLEAALTSILINPNFLFRIEEGREERAHGISNYPITDYELASRLSFFLWSSIPDEQLLDHAEAGTLHQPDTLAGQVQRMLKDERASSLVTNFASQWLYLRNLESITPDLRLYPDFDDNLRHDFRRETELLVEDVFRNDRNVLGLIQSDFTFLNQRLARHYGIPSVLGSHFRKVQVSPESHRGGLLRHGSVLTVTSYATRTSPTIRGNWILENIIGTPPPPPPPNIPALKEKEGVVASTLRERLALHRSDPACASCHNLMDPIGFSLDNFDALGRWRQFDDGQAIDSVGVMPDGSLASDAVGLEESILKRPQVFVGTMVEKLLTFALGRGIEHRDGPEVRKIVEAAAKQDYRFVSIIQAIVHSTPFMRRDTE